MSSSCSLTSNETDYIGETNDTEGKYFILEDYEENGLC